MRHFFILGLVLTFTIKCLWAQNDRPIFGSIKLEEANMEFYEKDPSADAVVLFDYGQTEFLKGNNGFYSRFKRHKRIKIFKESGVEWASIGIPFYNTDTETEKVEKIEAYTYNIRDGRLSRTKLDVKKVYEEKVSQFWSRKIFTLPQVKAGSVIEYRYQVQSPSKFKMNFDWVFQHTIPTAYSEYKFINIPFYDYTWLVQGVRQFDVFEEYTDRSSVKYTITGAYKAEDLHDHVTQFGLKDIPAFSSEDYITCMDDYIMKINFQLSKIHRLDGTDIEIISTWPSLIKDLLKEERFGRFMKKCQSQASKFISIEGLDALSEKERFEHVIDYVKQNYTWNGIYDKYAHQSPGDLLKKRVGNSTELNLLAIGLLQELEIDARPVLISTRNHGKVKSNFPFLHFFNSSIIYVKIDGKMILTDATQIFCSNYRVPPNCLNGKGLVVDKKDELWVGLKSSLSSKTHTVVKLKFQEDELAANVLVTATEYDAYHRRYDLVGNEDQKGVLEEEGFIIDETSIKTRFEKELNKPFVYSYELVTGLEKVQDKIYLHPFLGLPVDENKLTQKERTYPVDLIYPRERIFESRFTIPKGYTVEHIPEDVSIERETFDLSYMVHQEDGDLYVVFKYSFKQAIYPSAQYSKIKAYFNYVVENGGKKIVLVKE